MCACRYKQRGLNVSRENNSDGVQEHQQHPTRNSNRMLIPVFQQSPSMQLLPAHSESSVHSPTPLTHIPSSFKTYPLSHDLQLPSEPHAAQLLSFTVQQNPPRQLLLNKHCQSSSHVSAITPTHILSSFKTYPLSHDLQLPSEPHAAQLLSFTVQQNPPRQLLLNKHCQSSSHVSAITPTHILSSFKTYPLSHDLQLPSEPHAAQLLPARVPHVVASASNKSGKQQKQKRAHLWTGKRWKEKMDTSFSKQAACSHLLVLLCGLLLLLLAPAQESDCTGVPRGQCVRTKKIFKS